ncbi:MAG: DUF721 domain-containing protein [Oligoflexia bacterium]|nr:DUF721 domain-containing protein [Oligoflexia bacterium]
MLRYLGGAGRPLTMGFNGLNDIIKQVRERFPVLSRRISEAEALSRWEVAVGPLIAKHSRAIRVQDGVLWVEVDHPIWKSELHHRKRQILTILNGAIGKNLPAPKEILSDILFLDPRR